MSARLGPKWHPHTSLAASRFKYGWEADDSGPAEWLGEVRYTSTLEGWVWQATVFGEKESVSRHATRRSAMARVEASR